MVKASTSLTWRKEGEQALWVGKDTETAIWVSLLTTGDPPQPRFHHSADVIDGGHVTLELELYCIFSNFLYCIFFSSRAYC